MKRFGKIFQAIIIIIAAIIVAAELFARFALGLGNPLLFEPSKEYGYRIKPGQDVVRFGRRITINAQGLRNGPIEEAPRKGVLRILCLGDSITNGGEKTDQQKTYPYILQSILAQKGIPAEVLNASAPGWAIPNGANFIKTHGVFNSRIVIWLINDRDILEKQVTLAGHDPEGELPVKKPALALAEAMRPVSIQFSKAFLSLGNLFTPKKKIDEKEATILSMRTDAIALGLLPPDSKEGDYSRLQHILWLERLRVFDGELAELRAIAGYARSRGATLIVVFLDTPARERYKPGDEKGAADMYSKAVTESGGLYLDITGSLQSAGYEKLFRDRLHPNEEGNGVIARTLADYIERIVRR